MRSALIFLLLPLQIVAQDLAGVWTGYLQVGDTKLPYEIVISGKGMDLNGYSLFVFTFNGVENMGIKTLDFKIKRGGISIEDGELVYDNYTTPGRRVKLYGDLAWVGKDINMTLAGTFGTRSMDMRAPYENSFKGTIFLQRKGFGVQSRLVSKLNEMGLSEKLPLIRPDSTRRPQVENKPTKNKDSSADKRDLASRKTQVIRRVFFNADSVVISLYDNGEVDGDTVSVLLNGKVILSKQGLTAKAITRTIYSNEIGDSSTLVMFAENLGRIPPNTGLLILKAGYERYQVRFSGDLENNSAIILKRRH